MNCGTNPNTENKTEGYVPDTQTGGKLHLTWLSARRCDKTPHNSISGKYLSSCGTYGECGMTRIGSFTDGLGRIEVSAAEPA